MPFDLKQANLPLTVALLSNAVLLGIVAFTQRRNDKVVDILISQRDTVVHDLKITNTELVRAGDSIPFIEIVDADGNMFNLRDVVGKQGAKYIYFYRSDCPACGILAPFWKRAKRAQLDSVVFVAYHSKHDLNAEKAPAHYAWRHRSEDKKYIRAVPSLFVVDPKGVVVSVAHASATSVASVLDYYGIMSKQSVDSLTMIVRDSASKSITRN